MFAPISVAASIDLILNMVRGHASAAQCNPRCIPVVAGRIDRQAIPMASALFAALCPLLIFPTDVQIIRAIPG